MNTQEKIEFVRQAMNQMRGDDAIRAFYTFKGMSEKQLDQQWGASGKTCREVWQEYKDQDARWREVNEWLESRFPAF